MFNIELVCKIDVIIYFRFKQVIQTYQPNSFNKILSIRHKYTVQLYIKTMQQQQSVVISYQQYKHQNMRNDYTVHLHQSPQSLSLKLTQKFTLVQWKCQIKKQQLVDISRKTGYQISASVFIDVLRKALKHSDVSCYVDVLTAEDLENLKNRKSGNNQQRKSSQKQKQKHSASAVSKRYIILTYMTNNTKYHYPLSMSPHKLDLPTDKLKQIYNDLRVQLQAARSSALNDTQKSQSFSINYNNQKNGRNNYNKGNKDGGNREKQIDQVKSQNQILKAKLARLQEQVQKKKANIQIQAAIQRIKLLKQSIQTANLQLVDWKNNIQDQEQAHTDLKKQLTQLHKKICTLLQSQKQMTAKKKGQQVQKQLNQVKNTIKRNNIQIQKLKKQLQSSKIKIKDLEIKAKKLNSQKQVIRKGRKGPYSSAGSSVRSYNSFNSFNSAGKRSTGSNASSSSKAKSNYSYNSYSYNKRR